MFLGGSQSASSGPSLFVNKPATSGPAGGSLLSNPGTGGASTTPKAPFTVGGTGTSGASTTPNMFSNLSGSTPQAQTTAQSNTQSTSTANPFSAFSTSTSQPQGNTSKPSLFPSLNTLGTASSQAPQPQSTTTGSLSGSTLVGQQQQTSLGGAQQSNALQQQSGGPLAQLPGSLGTSSLFDTLLERGKKRGNQDGSFSNFNELPTLQLGLGDIARKVRNLGAGGPAADQATDRAAHYLLAASGVSTGSTLRDLNQFSTQAGLNTNGATSTIPDTDVDGYISNLHSQSTLALIQEGLEQSKRDFDAFLEDNVQIEWEAQRKRIYEHFGLGKQNEKHAASTAYSASTRGAFGRSTRKGRSAGPSASVNGRSFAASGATPVIGSVLSNQQKVGASFADSSEKSGSTIQYGPEDRFTREKQEKFIDVIKEFNDTRLEEKHYPILKNFAEVEAQSGADNTQSLIDAYEALVRITNEDNKTKESVAPVNAVKARCYLKEYLDDVPNSDNSVKNRKRILDGSREFLEQQFLKLIETTIDKAPRDAAVGGMPSVLSKVRGFVRVKMAYKELGADIDSLQRIGTDGAEFPWVIVFYLLRTGLRKVATDYVRDKKNFFQNNDRNFQAAIAHYSNDPDRRLSADLQQKINHTFAQRARIAPTNDPYRMACYKIVGRCEMSRRNLEPLKENMEDWVWLQFNLAREGNRAEENAGEIFGLDEIRTTISDIGQRHFQSGSEAAGGYGVYFYLSILAGMFEHAVNFLYQHNYVSAVHFAIALDYYGLLRISDWNSAGSETLTYTTRQQPQINFGRVVGHYTGDFRAARASAAADYLILICLNADLPGEAGKQQRDLCHEALRELVLETREFAELLGDVKDNGKSTPGTIRNRLGLIKLGDQRDYLETITREAAKMADDSGRTTDAVLLYHLAGEYDSVISILNRALSEALSVDLGQEPLRLEPLKPRSQTSAVQASDVASSGSSLSMIAIDDPVALAKKIVGLYQASPQYYGQIQNSNMGTIGTLLTLSDAKKFIEEARWAEALDLINTTQILPIDACGNLPAVRAKANNFASLQPEIARNIGNVLMWTITCCGRHREHFLNMQFMDATKKEITDQLLQAAKDLMVFAGLIRYKLPPRVFETLARQGQDAGVY